MPKVKTNRGAQKRFRKTGGSKIKRGSAFRRHILTKKTRERKRKLRQSAYIHASNVRAVKRLLPY